MKKSYIILGFFSLISLIVEGYFGFISLVSYFIQIILLSSVLGFLIYFVSTSPTKRYSMIVYKNILIMMATMGIFFTFTLSFIAYHNIYPASLSDITLHDGSTSVVFVQMSHIANEEFYREKNIQLQSLANSGYTLLVEGVRPGLPENQARFDAYIGFQFTETLYETLARLTGFQAQDNDRLYAGISTGSLVSVDISIDDIVGIMGDASPGFVGDIPDIEKELSLILQNMSHRDQKILNFLFRGILNWTLKNSGDIESTLMKGEKAGVFHAIIEKRNNPIIEYIRNHPGEKIAVIYGALHFNGVYEGLQKISQNWKVTKIEHTYPYR